MLRNLLTLFLGQHIGAVEAQLLYIGALGTIQICSQYLVKTSIVAELLLTGRAVRQMMLLGGRERFSVKQESRQGLVAERTAM